LNWFLHEKGYTFFDIPKLTYPEINSLILISNKLIKEQNRQARKNKRR